jgi:hypothetical protein
MEPRSSSRGRTSAFTSGTGADQQLTEKDILIELAKAAPGAVANAAKNEYALSPEVRERRAAGHVVNFASDVVQGVANVGINAVNAFSGRETAVIPNIRTPKLNVNSSGDMSLAGGSVDKDTKVGTRGSLGFRVEGDPLETVSRGIEGVGLIPFLKPIKAVKGATNAVTNEIALASRGVTKVRSSTPVAPTSTIVRDSAQETARESKRIVPSVNTTKKSNQFLTPEDRRAGGGNVTNITDAPSRRTGPPEYETQGPLAIKPDVKPTDVPDGTPDASPGLRPVPHSAKAPDGKSKPKVVGSPSTNVSSSPAADPAADPAKSDEGSTKPTKNDLSRPKPHNLEGGQTAKQSVQLQRVF